MIYRKSQFIKTVSIDLKEFFDNEETVIELREPTVEETYEITEAQKQGEKETIKCFKAMFPTFIISHNFFETEEKKMSNEQVIEILFSKVKAAMKLIEDYSANVFFIEKKKGK